MRPDRTAPAWTSRAGQACNDTSLRALSQRSVRQYTSMLPGASARAIALCVLREGGTPRDVQDALAVWEAVARRNDERACRIRRDALELAAEAERMLRERAERRIAPL